MAIDENTTFINSYGNQQTSMNPMNMGRKETCINGANSLFLEGGFVRWEKENNYEK